MIVKCLMENTTGLTNIKAEHGLSLYIETGNIKILFDMGQTDAFAYNAEQMGVDLSEVDYAVLSHGHYDHSGGLEKFLQINSKAPVFMSKYAFEPHFNGTKYIGIKPDLRSERFIFTGDTYDINENLMLLSCNKYPKKYPIDSFGLSVKRQGKFSDEDFIHEQYLLIKENSKRILISGCSHKGILNIEEWFSPDVLIGGFHFKKLQVDSINDAARLKRAADELNEYNTKYYTCHCTGTEQYKLLKETMKEKLNYLSAGQTVEI